MLTVNRYRDRVYHVIGDRVMHPRPSKIITIALAIVPALAVAYSNLGPATPDQIAPLVMVQPGTTIGPMIENDANTVAHVTFDGSSIVDSFNTWTQHGTVPHAIPPLYPSGFASNNVRRGSGPYSDTNYYDLPGTSLTQTTFTLCVVFVLSSLPSASVSLFDKSDFGTKGYTVMIDGPASHLDFVSEDGLADVLTSNAAVIGPNVVCAGSNGTTMYNKLNLGTIVSQSHSLVQDTTDSPTLGRLSAATGFGASTADILEVWLSTTAPSDALFTNIQNRVLGMLGVMGFARTNSRSTTESYHVIGTSTHQYYYTAANTDAIDSHGINSWKAATQLLGNTEDFSATGWAAGVGVTSRVANFAGDPFGNVTSTYVKNTGGTTASTVSQAVTVASGTGPWTFSAWVNPGAGSTVESIGITFGAGSATGCTCATESKSGTVYTCTAATSTATGYAYVNDTGSELIRLSLTCSTTVATTTVTPFVFPGQYGTTTDDGVFFGAQLEAGSFSTPYIQNTGAAGSTVTRPADVITVANLAPGGLPGAVCLDATATPGAGHNWSFGAVSLMTLGVHAAANTASLYVVSGQIRFLVEDSGDNSKLAQSTPTYSDTGTHRVMGCTDGSGNLSIYVDGAPISTTITGTGAGNMSAWPSTVYIGRLFTNGSEWNGGLQNVKICRRPAVECLQK